MIRAVCRNARVHACDHGRTRRRTVPTLADCAHAPTGAGRRHSWVWRPAKGPMGSAGFRQARGAARHLLLVSRRSGVLYALRLRQERPGRSHGGPGTRARENGSGGIQMKAAAFQELVTSIRQAGRIRRGTLKASRVTTFRPADVKSVRGKLGASQAEFALMIGVSVATLRNWEQGRRT